MAHYCPPPPSDLSEAAQTALSSVALGAKGKRNLDIGVGSGHTVAASTAVSGDHLGIDHIGIDNSAAVVSACQTRFADQHCPEVDARVMPALPDASVQLAMFSCNGIGKVSHADRPLILREVFRVLQRGECWLFSTPSQNSPDATARWGRWRANLKNELTRGLTGLGDFRRALRRAALRHNFIVAV